MAMLAIVSVYALGGRCGQNVVWELSKDGTLVISGSGPMEDFGRVRPWRNVLVNKVVIENGVSVIGKNAFNGCSRMHSVSIPASVVHIGDGAFKGCKSLVAIVLPYNLQTIGKQAFEKAGLMTVDIPDQARLIGDEAFAYCDKLAWARVPATLISMGADVFVGCDLLNKFTELPDFVTNSTSGRYGISPILAQKYREYREQRQRNDTTVFDNDGLARKSDGKEGKKSVATPYGTADIDKSIPEALSVNENTFAVIIANENYGKLSNVPYAINDGKSFYQYCKHTLGIPDRNLRYYQDATYGDILDALTDIENIDRAFDGDIRVIFYYAGHGAPDEKNKEAFLLPTDASGTSRNVSVPLKEVYNRLGALKALSVTVFLDACFSGATREEDMLLSARSVAVEPKAPRLSGNVVVVSASSGKETALSYDEKGHGLFTYFLLKKLQESGGTASLGELSEYVSESVNRLSVVINRKSQTPTVSASSDVSNVWKFWHLK